MLTRDDLKGPWAGMPVAWDENLDFDEKAYRTDLERTCKAGVPGVYTAGTTGEFYAMELDEWKQISRVTVEVCKEHDTPDMIGITSTYTLGAQRRAAYAAEIGADAVQVALPYWMELDDRQITGFFADVVGSCPGLALTIYETMRTKKALTLEQHRAIFDETGCYCAVKSNSNTLGDSPEGCRQLSEFINVWVSEELWSTLGPCGAIGCASALVYANPRIILHMFDLLEQQSWEELKPLTDMLSRLFEEGLAPFSEKGFTDTAYDHLQGLATGFLSMNPRSRGTYISATEADVQQLRDWLATNIPEFLELQ